MSEEKDFEDLRVHFSDAQWKKLKEVEKIIYLNQMSNHLFKLSLGLKSRAPHFMRTSAPQPRKRKRREEEEWISSDEESDDHPVTRVKKTVPTCDRRLRSQAKAVNYTEPDPEVMETEEEPSTSYRRLRNRTDVVKYTDDHYVYDFERENHGDPEFIHKEESEDEWIPSDEESVECESHGSAEFIEDSPTAAGDATENDTVFTP